MKNKIKLIAITALVAAMVFGMAAGFTACVTDTTEPDTPTFTVTFVSNGGSNVPPQTVAKGFKVTKPDPNPTRTGDWYFVGWFSDQALTTEWNFTADTVTGDVTLYAKWTVSAFTVTFNSNGGSDVDSKKVGEGGKVPKPSDPAKQDWYFVGWYKEQAFTTLWDFDTDTVTTDVTLYAKWTDVAFTVTFNSGTVEPVSDQLIVEGGKAEKPGDPVRELVAGLYVGTPDEFTFEGWFDADDVEWDFDDIVTADLELTAKWEGSEPIPYATVAANDLTAAVDYVKATPAAYTLLIDTDLDSAGAPRIDVADFDLTIIGIETERTIQVTGGANALLFNIRDNGPSLTLGNNITLRGKNDATNTVVYVQGGSLTMKAGAKITGHTTTSTGGAVYINGSGSKFIMEGGEISGNTSTDTGNAAYAGVYVNGGQFVMSGGTISGNFSAYNTTNNDTPADMGITETASFTLSGNANIGTLILSASATATASVTLDKAYTGTVDALNLRRNDAIATVITLWVDKPLIKAGGSYNLTAADIGSFTLGEFITNNPANNRPITGNNAVSGFDNYYIETTGDDVGKLLKVVEPPLPAGLYTGTPETITAEDRIAGVTANNVKAIENHVYSNPGTYTLVIDTNVGAGNIQIISTGDVNLSIIGVGAERTITNTGAANQPLFIIASAGGSLTLGNNITLKGGEVNSTANLVVVGDGTLIMKAGSKITGHTTNHASGAVAVTPPEGVFIMEGGEITGNHTTSTNGYSAGGVRVLMGKFVMTGGTISGNTNAYTAANNPADVSSSNLFTLSGEAVIGALTLHKNTGSGSIARPVVTLGGSYTGTVSVLNLSSTGYIEDIIPERVNELVIAAEAGYTLIAADIGRFTLGKFLTNIVTENRPITDNTLPGPPVGTDIPEWANYRIANSGADIGKLVSE